MTYIMSDFNLDIDAYKDSELEGLMGLTIPYSYKDVTDAQEVLLRQLTNDAELTPERKSEIALFVDSVASRIANRASQRYIFKHQKPHQKPHVEGTWAENKVPIAQYGSNVIIKNPNEIIGKHAKITEGRISMSGEVPPGYINPINVRTTSRAINIDSRFRPNYYKTSSTQFSMRLPAIEKRVVRMTVGALEIPLTYHAISERLGNNRCLIIDNCSNFYPDPSGWLVTLPNGIYGTNELKGAPGSAPSIAMDIEIGMNNAIATADAGTVNTNTGIFTLTGGPKLNPARDVCYRWDRISGRSVFACPENAGSFVGAGNKVWKDRGQGPQNWGDGNVPSIASSSVGDKLVAVANNDNIFLSTDYGVTWGNQTTPVATQNWKSVASNSDGTKLAAVTAIGNIWLSTNSGVDWIEVAAATGPPIVTPPPAAQNWRSIASNSDGSILAAAIQAGTIYVSTNSGFDWTASTAPALAWRCIASDSAGTNLAATAYGPVNGNIYVSSDSGANWTDVTTLAGPSPPTNQLWTGIAVDSTATNLAAVMEDGNIWLSTNSGVGWVQVVAPGIPSSPTPSQFWSDVAMSNDGTVIVAVPYGGHIWKSTDSGAKWIKDTTAGSRNWRSVASNAAGDRLAAVVFEGNIWTWPYTTPVCHDLLVRFTIDEKGNLDMNDSIQFKLGWQLGFRGGEYMTSGAAVSEGICYITGPRYGFLAINDYQKNRGKSYMLAFANSSLDENIIMRLNLAAAQDQVGVYKSANDPGLTTTMNTSRDYFGPVDIQKLAITLYDEYGRVMDLNNMNWSFALTLERLYD
jgi:hypothetical protein